MDHVKGAVLLEHACGWLRTERVMRPAVSAVERIIASAVVEADHETFRRIEGVLTAGVRARLDSLLVGGDEISTSRLLWLRQADIGATTRISISPRSQRMALHGPLGTPRCRPGSGTK